MPGHLRISCCTRESQRVLGWPDWSDARIDSPNEATWLELNAALSTRALTFYRLKRFAFLWPIGEIELG